LERTRRLDHLLEALLGVRILRHVGVQLAGKRAKALLDLRLGGGAGDAEQFVVVVDRGHQFSP
jgi:hypothetical protein